MVLKRKVVSENTQEFICTWIGIAIAGILIVVPLALAIWFVLSFTVFFDPFITREVWVASEPFFWVAMIGFAEIIVLIAIGLVVRLCKRLKVGKG